MLRVLQDLDGGIEHIFEAVFHFIGLFEVGEHDGFHHAHEALAENVAIRSAGVADADIGILSDDIQVGAFVPDKTGGAGTRHKDIGRLPSPHEIAIA